MRKIVKPNHWSQSSVHPVFQLSVPVVIHAYHHFSFLQNINLNDQVILSDQMGMEYQYCVVDVSIIDLSKDTIIVSETDELKLVTPWPFDGHTKDTLRYVVTARKYETYQN